jgi:DNA-binding NarL/FixJ family response regulator
VGALGKVLQAELSSRTRVIRVGLVDDHPVFRVGLTEVLQRDEGIAVLWAAASRAEARRRAAETPVDLVVVDLSLEQPGDGVELTRELVAEHPDLRLVALSGSPDPELAAAALKAGASRFLDKATSPPDIVAALRHVGGGPRHPGRGSSSARSLSEREIQVLGEIRRGRTNREIAARLGISPTTVNKHVHRVLTKLGAKNRAQAAGMLGPASGQQGRKMVSSDH